MLKLPEVSGCRPSGKESAAVISGSNASGICKELKRKGVTKEMLYKDYIAKYPEGYSICHFNGLICLYLAQSRPVMYIEHKAGDKMYIDFTGQKHQLDNVNGTKTEVEVFVAILGCSQLTYVEIVES